MPSAAVRPAASARRAGRAWPGRTGFCGAIHGANSAIAMIDHEQRQAGQGQAAFGELLAEALPRRLDRRHRRRRRAHVRPPRQPHARVEHRVEQVDHEVDHDEHEHDHHQVGHHHRPVELEDRVDHQLAHAGPREDRLGDDGEGDHRAQLQPDHRHQRNQDVLQQVHADDARARQALGAREADVVEQRSARAPARASGG